MRSTTARSSPSPAGDSWRRGSLQCGPTSRRSSPSRHRSRRCVSCGSCGESSPFIMQLDSDPDLTIGRAIVFLQRDGRIKDGDKPRGRHRHPLGKPARRQRAVANREIGAAVSRRHPTAKWALTRLRTRPFCSGIHGTGQTVGSLVGRLRHRPRVVSRGRLPGGRFGGGAHRGLRWQRRREPRLL
jgi:hypothetical protein